MKPIESSPLYNIAILGGGSFGTALSDISATNGHTVRIWMRSQEQVDAINNNHINHKYLPNFKINPAVTASCQLSEVLNDADIVLVAIPSHSFRKVIKKANSYLNGKIVISTTKGIEPETFSLMSEILHQELKHAHIGVLSGPNLAKEIVTKTITASVFASQSPELCALFQKVLHCDYFRIYTNKDVYGIELAGALKNIYAIITGLGAAIKMGENTKSLLITRSLAEMSRFAVKLGANPLTFLGLAGVGDLIATCTSSLSRNFQLGYALGQGYSLEQAIKKLQQEAEGVNTLKQVYHKAQELDVYMPLASGLYKIMFENYQVSELIKNMMMNEPKTDVEFILH